MYHVTVMPCYDKKLEASRKDFYSEQHSSRDVDCVLTTGELELIMRERGWDLSNPVPGENDVVPAPSFETMDGFPFGIPDLLQHPGSSSGSYLQHLIDFMSSSAPSPSSLSLSTRRIRNDYEEYTLTDTSTGTILFKGAKCYGFRNLQNVVRKVGREHGLGVGKGSAAKGQIFDAGTRGKGASRLRETVAARRRAAGSASTTSTTTSEDVSSSGVLAAAARGYDYVEVMACPGGCVNGGGQIKAPSRPLYSQSTVPSTVNTEDGSARKWQDSGVVNAAEPDMMASERWGDKEWVKRVETAYWSGLPTPPPSPPTSVASLLSSPPSSGPSTVSSLVQGARSGSGTAEAEPLPSFAIANALAANIEREMCGEDSNGLIRELLFRTSYQAVESEVVGLAVKW
jgi:iron only hydrogenase large subunit-like protein